MVSTSRHQVVCFGEVLWDILPSGPLPGGAPMNVAYHLKKLGLNPALITKIGLDDYGKELITLLSESDVSTEFFDVDYSQPTGLVYANISQHQDVSYDIVNPSAWDFINWQDEFAALVNNADYFVYGSLTSRNKTSRETLYRLLELGATKVLDINLRPPHFNRTHIKALLQKADVLKMNVAELELITGWFSRFNQVEDRVKLVQERFQIPTVIVTMGGEGALLSHEGKFLRHGGFTITVADTIGSGDAFLAGYLSQIMAGASVEGALQFASATGAFIATQSGACPAYQVSAIQQLMAATSPSALQPNPHH